MSVTPELLKRFIALKSLPAEALQALAAQARLCRYARRQIVVDPGQPEHNLYLLFEGSLQAVDFTLDGREVGLYFVRPGDLCGELALFHDQTGTEFIIALAKSQVVVIPHSALEDLMYLNPELVKALTRRLAQRVHQLTEQRSLLSLSSIPQRVYRQLWILTGLDTSEPPESQTEAKNQNRAPVQIDLPPTQQELAIMLNTSRETVTRIFQALLADEIIQRSGSKTLIITQPDKLWQLAYAQED